MAEQPLPWRERIAMAFTIILIVAAVAVSVWCK